MIGAGVELPSLRAPIGALARLLVPALICVRLAGEGSAVAVESASKI
jgi:hypothetical protein